MFLSQISFAESDGELFLAAKNAALQDNWPLFNSLKEQLANYPLLPYLDYYQIAENIKTADPATIQQYLDKYPHTPMAAQLRQNWLNQLAEQKNWQAFLAMYQPTSNVALQCAYLYALQQTGKAPEAAPQIAPIWLTGFSQPQICNAVFEPWLDSMPIKNALIWERFHLALKDYNFGLANYLSDQLPPLEKNDAEAIVKLYAQPSLVINKTFLKQHPSPEVISYGIARLARINPTTAINVWEELEYQYTFTADQKQRIFQSIALKLALRKNSDSLIWFRKIVGDNLDPVYEDWLIKAALYHNDWRLVKDRISAMPISERELSEWRYWYARALEKLGEQEAAHKIFATVATERNYYGFLASTHINQPIHIINAPPTITSAEIETVEKMPAFRRAELLYQLKLNYDASLELFYLLKTVTPIQQYIIVRLVSNWNWYPQTLILSAKANFKNDVDLRFPLLYQSAVIRNADLRKINAALVYAIIRQESYFGSSAISPAGAIGLMQLMPTTAFRTSKKLQIKYNDINELLNADTNIAFGTAHLQQVIVNFGNNAILAVAAYNAGSEAVSRWLPQSMQIPADIWIETIPFHETRNYLKNVISNYVVYEYRLGLQPNLKNILRAIGSTVTQNSKKK